MNKIKNRQKVSISYDHGKQLSIRKFFSSNYRKVVAEECDTKTSASVIPLSALDETKNVDENCRSCLKIIDETSNEKAGKNQFNMLSGNAKCDTTESLKKKDNHADVSEMRKEDADGVLKDLLDELENSSPEEYIYSQSLVSSRKRNTSSSVDYKRSPNFKCIKLSHSPMKNVQIHSSKTLNENIEKNDSANGKTDTDEQKLPIERHIEPDKNRTITSSGSSSVLKEQNKVASRLKTSNDASNFTDIENLADLLDHDWDDFQIMQDSCSLDLSKWTYCKVQAVDYRNDGILLKLVEFFQHSPVGFTTCILKGCWFDTPIKVDDIVSVKAHFSTNSKCWLVDNEEGFIIIYPDILLTGTSVVGSLFCSRRSILSYVFPGSDPPNIAMVIGSLVHELLQEILRKKLYTLNSMKQIVDNLLKCKRTLFLAYECDVALTAISKELNEFLPRIRSFINAYITKTGNERKTWSGEILEVLSIEENFWIPPLGIKGKTDVILKARENDVKILPLELKTGRAANSSEHRGQIILYSMMMCETGMDVDSGLLLYLRENELTEIKPKHPERSGLLSMRNNLVNYIVANETLKMTSDDQFELPILPEPINHHRGCSKCSYLTVCSASLSKKHHENMSKDNPLNKLSVTALEHLSELHIRYVFFWFGLLKLEEEFRKQSRSFDISDLWHMPEVKREARGYCVSKLCVKSVEVFGSKFLHKMKRTIDNEFDFTACDLTEGDYVVISKASRFAIAAGYVHIISEKEISFKLDRELEKSDETLYTADKYSMYDSLLGFNTSSLLLLFENSIQAQRLRSFVIDMEAPSFSNVQVVEPQYDKSILRALNISQKNAVLKTLCAQDYMLIKGMPGTGKTATIVALVKLLVALNYTVLITSHTHSAVDNILLRLKGSVDFLRLGSYIRVHNSLKQYSEDFVLEKNNFQTVQDLENFYNKKQVVAVTCMGCSHALFRKRQFDYCIVDEATQVMQPSIMKPLYCSKKFILIGDPEQLPPVVQSKKASNLGLNESLFKRLDKPSVTSILNLQYRMNSEIMKLANSFTYQNALQCANEQINSATIDTQKLTASNEMPPWLQLSLSKNLSNSVVLLNTTSLRNESTSEYSNQNEVVITFKIVEILQQVCGKSYDVGVITPYREQVELLRKMANSKNLMVEINTVDQYQGRDKDVVIYSCTKSSSTRDSGILSDKRRLTVAITRAKRKLIIIGNVTILETYSVFKELFNYISKENVVDVDCL